LTDFRDDTTFDDSSRGGRGQVYFVQIQVELRALDPFADVVQILAQQDAIEQQGTVRGQVLHTQNGTRKSFESCLLKLQISPKEVFIDYRTYPKEEAKISSLLFKQQSRYQLQGELPSKYLAFQRETMPEGEDALLLVPEGDDADFYFLILPANVLSPFPCRCRQQ
jgi:hypothetical protein